MVKTKPSCYPEGNHSKNLTEKHKGKAPKKKSYGYKRTRTETQGPEFEAETDFKDRCIDLEGSIFDLGPRASDKFAKTMKELERYLGATCRNICQPEIITKIPETLPDSDITMITPDTYDEHTNMDGGMTYLKNKNTDEDIHQKTRKKYVYKTDMHKIYNMIVGKKNEQLQEKAASDATFQVVKSGQDPIG